VVLVGNDSAAFYLKPSLWRDVVVEHLGLVGDESGRLVLPHGQGLPLVRAAHLGSMPLLTNSIGAHLRPGPRLAHPGKLSALLRDRCPFSARSRSYLVEASRR
jgi:hypothetical protein